MVWLSLQNWLLLAGTLALALNRRRIGFCTGGCSSAAPGFTQVYADRSLRFQR
jgi:hypothetical protein